MVSPSSLLRFQSRLLFFQFDRFLLKNSCLRLWEISALLFACPRFTDPPIVLCSVAARRLHRASPEAPWLPAWPLRAEAEEGGSGSPQAIRLCPKGEIFFATSKSMPRFFDDERIMVVYIFSVLEIWHRRLNSYHQFIEKCHFVVLYLFIFMHV